jgi:hypothetical protein
MTRNGLPDGLLAVENESPELLMSGVYGLNWLPTGPAVLEQILRWAGFPETRLSWWREEVQQGVGRLEMLGSKKPGLLDAFLSSATSAS